MGGQDCDACAEIAVLQGQVNEINADIVEINEGLVSLAEDLNTAEANIVTLQDGLIATNNSLSTLSGVVADLDDTIHDFYAPGRIQVIRDSTTAASLRTTNVFTQHYPSALGTTWLPIAIFLFWDNEDIPSNAPIVDIGLVTNTTPPSLNLIQSLDTSSDFWNASPGPGVFNYHYTSLSGRSNAEYFIIGPTTNRGVYLRLESALSGSNDGGVLTWWIWCVQFPPPNL